MKLYDRQDDFTGGSAVTPPTGRLAANQCYMVNWRWNDNGTVSVRHGCSYRSSSTLNGTGSGSYTGKECWGLFRLPSGTLVGIYGQTAYTSTDHGVTWAAIAGATGLREDYWCGTTVQVGGTTYLCLANGGTSGYKYDGTTWSAITNFPSGMFYVATHNNRLWATSGSQTVYASAVDDIETWASPDGLTVPVLTANGEGITAIYGVGGLLLVFTQNSMSYIDGYGDSDIIVAAGARGISNTIGCRAFRSIVAVSPRTIHWLSSRGIEGYTVGGDVEWLNPHLNVYTPYQYGSRGELPHANYRPDTNEYTVFYPRAQANNTTDWALHRCVTNGALWMSAFNTLSGLTQYDLPTASVVTETTTGGRATLSLLGNREGRVIRWQQDTYSVDLHSGSGAVNVGGYDYLATFRTRPFTFGNENKRKRVRSFRIRGGVQGGAGTGETIENVSIIADPNVIGDSGSAQTTAVDVTGLTSVGIPGNTASSGYKTCPAVMTSIRGNTFALEVEIVPRNEGKPQIQSIEMEAELTHGARR